MKNVILLILFIAYTIAVFLINNLYCLTALLLITLLLYAFYKIPIKKIISYNIQLAVFFIFFTVLVSVICNNFDNMLQMILQLFLICNATYLFRYIVPTVAFIDAVEKLLFPLNLFKINTRDIGIILNIAITFVPILTEEITQIQNSLVQKGIKRNSIKSFKYTFKVLIPLLFKKTNEVDYSLRAKCYID